ncbi:MAG: TetR/AcrR family transcriptional regulator [Acidimicrobiia bacterium]|nr:TetR/AcrR family transcriptional regulator [Acidimicrobiia bacterium]
MEERATRAERTEQIRTEVLAAALDIFLARGYHGASLDQIALAAGYTKGVVYSRFESKADLFLAMVEARIDGRAEQNRRVADGLFGVDGLVELIRRLAAAQRDDLTWALLLIEFRAHAARHSDLTAAYGRLHAGTIERLTSLFTDVVGAASAGRSDVLREAAQVLLGIGTAASLEQAVDPQAFPPAVLERIVRALVGGEG